MSDSEKAVTEVKNLNNELASLLAGNKQGDEDRADKEERTDRIEELLINLIIQQAIAYEQADSFEASFKKTLRENAEKLTPEEIASITTNFRNRLMIESRIKLKTKESRWPSLGRFTASRPNTPEYWKKIADEAVVILKKVLSKKQADKKPETAERGTQEPLTNSGQPVETAISIGKPSPS